MDGFEVQRTTGKLMLHGAFEGAWVRVRLDASLEQYLELGRMGRKLGSEQDIEDIPVEEVRALWDFYADAFLMDWNLQEEGQTIPCNAEGLRSLPVALQLALITATVEHTSTGVSGPLAEPSPNGNTQEGIKVKTAAS